MRLSDTTVGGFVHSSWQSLRHEIKRPHHIETALGRNREDGTRFLALTTGPWWLAAASRALLAADTVTGHWWCNRGPFRGAGLAVREMELLDEYGTELQVAISGADALAWERAMGWVDNDD